MNSLEIENILSTISENKAIVYVIAKDELESIHIHEKLPTIVCINSNTSTSKNIFGHWLLLFIRQTHGKFQCIEFDSFGKKLSFYGINHSYYVANRNLKELQSHQSKVCGHFIIYVSFHLLYGISFCSILKSFSDDRIKNDLKVLEFVKYMLCLLRCRKASSKERFMMTCGVMCEILTFYQQK